MIVNLDQHLWQQALLYPCMMVIFFQILQYLDVLLGTSVLNYHRPDISFTVNKVCQFIHQPTSSHWQVVKRIFRYLKGTPSHSLSLFLSNQLQILLLLVIVMLTGLAAQMISEAPMVTLTFLVLISSHGLRLSK